MKDIALRGHSAPAAVIIVPLFFVLNSSLNMLNRWALRGSFHFPLTLTCCHATFGFAVMLPVVVALGRLKQYVTTFRRQWRGILVVGFCLAANIGANNLSLVHLSLSLNQVIRASLPVVTAVVTAGVERRLPRRAEMVSLLILSTGVALAIAEATAHGNTAGVLICMCGVLAGASMLAATNSVLSEKLDVMQLALFTSPITCLALLPLAAVRESAGFVDYLAMRGAGGTAIGIILAGSVIAALYNIVHYAMVHTTSPVTTCVFGQAKIVGLLILSALFLGETKEFTLRMSVGCALALTGFGLYSWLRLAAVPRTAAAMLERRSSSADLAHTPGAGGGGAPAAAKPPPGVWAAGAGLGAGEELGGRGIRARAGRRSEDSET